MPKNVIITPASGLIDFKDDAGNIDASIQLNDTGDLIISNPGGSTSIGDNAADVYIGDGVNSVDIIFEQNGAVKALTGKTLTLGQADSSISVASPTTFASTLAVSGLITGRPGTGGVVAVSNDAGSISVRGNATNAAVISFHRPSIYAINMGLDTDNVFKIGGWSATANVFQLTGAGVLTIASTINSNNLLLQGDGTNAYVRPTNSGSLYLGANNTNIAVVNTTGILPVANVTYNLGSATAWWNNVYGVSVQAKYADLAEHYVADSDYPPGTVVVFGGPEEITTTNVSHDTRVAGVISTDPAYLMNAASDGLPVALTGRVPCQVQGPVFKGQVLVTSSTLGTAQGIDNTKFLPGCVVGKALEHINTSTIETIEVVVGRF